MNDVNFKKRNNVIFIVIFVILFLFLANLFYTQVFVAKEDLNGIDVEADVAVTPARGEIYDTNGYPIATNEQVNEIVFDNLTFMRLTQDEQNDVIFRLIALFNKYDIEWNDNLPIKIKNKTPIFDDEKPNEVSYLKSKAFLNLNYYATAQNCFDALCDMYDLSKFKQGAIRNISSVYYGMVKDGFNKTTPYVFSNDVPTEIVSVIKESADLFVGVDCKIGSKRVYTDGTIAPHIIGSVSKISPEEYEQKKDTYRINDVIGKSGIEYTYEEQLRGTVGKKHVEVDRNGNKHEYYIDEPKNGDTIVLTIDSKLQKVAQTVLNELIEKKHEENKNVKAGAVVAMNAKTGAVLAVANYPTFDLNELDEKAEELSKDKTMPLWNRALKSTYTPGSTIKPCVAMAGLEEKAIDKDSIVVCGGKYKYYSDYQPGCTGVHGSQDVVSAIFHSCNIFFYETARRLGIEKLNDYFAMFGLGQKTGVELSESAGTVDSPAFRKTIGDYWTPGLTIQAGIGHGDNLFTPIQLCSYISTVANKGVRYKAHFVKTILSSDYQTAKKNEEITVLSKANFQNKNWKLVFDGMKLVGTKSYADFSKVPVTVGAKTGTTTVKKAENNHGVEVNNGLILAFAPFENPEIAVAVVVEGASSGGSTAPVASKILQEYFKTTTKKDSILSENALIR